MPIDESEDIGGVTGDAEGVDEGGGEDRLLEAVRVVLAIEVGEYETNSWEEGEELLKLGALLRCRLALLHHGKRLDNSLSLDCFKRKKQLEIKKPRQGVTK